MVTKRIITSNVWPEPEIVKKEVTDFIDHMIAKGCEPHKIIASLDGLFFLPPKYRTSRPPKGLPELKLEQFEIDEYVRQTMKYDRGLFEGKLRRAEAVLLRDKSESKPGPREGGFRRR